MAHNKAILIHLYEHGLHHFNFSSKSDKPVKAVIHLCINTSLQDITLALQELGYDVKSTKQMTNKCPSLDGSIPQPPCPHS